MTDNLLANIEKFKLPIGLSLLGIVLIIGGIFTAGLNKSGISRTKEFPKESLVESTKMVSVDVSGAVSKPGVYQLKDGSRIEEAIAAASGFNQTVNKEYVSKYLNMAQKLSDGTKIYVPSEGEMGGGSSAVAGTNTQTKININNALQSEIESLPGIGPTTASKIISSRPYQQIEDLLNKKVVGKSVFEKIKDLVVVY